MVLTGFGNVEKFWNLKIASQGLEKVWNLMLGLEIFLKVLEKSASFHFTEKLCECFGIKILTENALCYVKLLKTM